jgi:ankyrin repeat protein
MDFERSIHNAVLINNLDRVKKMISQINQVDPYGYTPLLYGCRKGTVEMCRFLIENGANVNQSTGLGRVSCLHRAVMGGHVKIVDLLLQNGANPSAIDKDGRSILDLAHSLEEPAKSLIIALLATNK